MLGLIIVVSIEIVVGEGLVFMVGGVDIYIYFIVLQQCWMVFELGVIIMIGGGIGFIVGILVMICMLGQWYIYWMLESFVGLLFNFGLFGKGNVSIQFLLVEQIWVGVFGFKLYEDWGIIFVVIYVVFSVVEDYDVQVVIYIDIFNELGFVEDVIWVFVGCIIYIFYIEGVGGGYVLDIIWVVGLFNVFLSSINFIMLFMVNIIYEYFDMLMVCYYFLLCIFEDVYFVELCICFEMIVVEDVLYDLGVFLMMSSDLQVMGCVGEVIICIWQVVYKMKVQCGLFVFDGCVDNFCVWCYVVKYIINFVIVYGISYEVGSVEVGKFVDFVLWSLVFFGVKFSLIFKGGLVVVVQMGDVNVSIFMLQLVYLCLMFVVYGGCLDVICLYFVFQVGLEGGYLFDVGCCYSVVKYICDIGKKDMQFNVEMFDIQVNFEIYEVCVNGEFVICELVDELLLVQKYFLF